MISISSPTAYTSVQLRAALNSVPSGGMARLGEGRYDLSGLSRFLMGGVGPEIAFVGAGRERTQLVCSAPFSYPGRADTGPAFDFGNTIVEGLTLVNENPTDDDSQSCVAGFGSKTQMMPAVARCYDVGMKGTEWGGYIWPSIEGNVLELYDCVIEAAINGLTLGRSNGALSQIVRVFNTLIILTPANSRYVGDVSKGGVIGIATRGGKLTTAGCSINIHLDGSEKNIPRAVGVCDNFVSGNPATPGSEGSAYSSQRHMDLLVSIAKPAGSTIPIFDAHQAAKFTDKMNVVVTPEFTLYGNCKGSGPGDALITSGKVLVVR